MSNNVTWKRRRAARLMLGGASLAHVGAELGARPETVAQWQLHPDFLAEMERLRQSLHAQMEIQLYMLSVHHFQEMCEKRVNAEYEFQKPAPKDIMNFVNLMKDNNLIDGSPPKTPTKPPKIPIRLTEIPQLTGGKPPPESHDAPTKSSNSPIKSPPLSPKNEKILERIHGLSSPEVRERLTGVLHMLNAYEDNR